MPWPCLLLVLNLLLCINHNLQQQQFDKAYRTRIAI